MKRLFIILSLAAMLAPGAFATTRPEITNNIVFDNAAPQFTIEQGQWNSPRLTFYTFSSEGTVYDPTGMTATYYWSTNEYAGEISSMLSIAGSVSTNRVYFDVSTNDFGYLTDRGYAVIYLKDDAVPLKNSFARGWQVLLPSPEIGGGNAPLPSTPTDWALIGPHSNVGTHFPLQPGSNVVYRSVGSNGWYYVDVPAATLKTIIGGSNITVTGGASASVTTVALDNASSAILNTVSSRSNTWDTISDRSNAWDTAVDDSTNAGALAVGITPAARYAPCSNLWYVAKCGSDANSGRSIYAPKLTIQNAHDSGIGQGSRTILVSPGTYGAVTNFANGENVALIGSAAKNTTITSLDIATNHQGATVRHFSFLAAVTVGNQFYLQEGTPTTYEVLLQDVAFIELNLTSFTDSPFKVWGGSLEMKDCTFIALDADFTGMGTGTGDWMSISNSPEVHMHDTEFRITDMVNTNISVNMIHVWSASAFRNKGTTMDITWSGSMDGEVRALLVETNSSSEMLVQGAEIHIIGDDDTVGEAEGIVGRGNAHVRAEDCIVNITGFLKRYSYETYDNATMDVNGASDVASIVAEGVAGSIDYSGSPEDNLFQFGSARFGHDGDVRTEWPLPSDISGHNGIAYVALGQASEIVSGEAVIYNNMITANDGASMPLTDSDSAYMNMTMTITNWSTVDNDGENAAGTLFPQKAVRGNIKNNSNGSTGQVIFTGAVVGETYVLEILGSAAHGGKPCDDMTYWMDNSNTQTVSVIDNTSTLAYITNTATSSTMTLYCQEANGDDPYLNAFRMTGPSASGYVRTDGESVMTGALDMGGYGVTNVLDPVNAQDAVTKAWAESQFALTNAAKVKTLVVGTTASVGSTLGVGAALTIGGDVTLTGGGSIKGSAADDQTTIGGGDGNFNSSGGYLALSTNLLGGNQLPNGDYVGGYIAVDGTTRGFAFTTGTPLIGNVNAYMDSSGNWVFTNDVEVVGTLTAVGHSALAGAGVTSFTNMGPSYLAGNVGVGVASAASIFHSRKGSSGSTMGWYSGAAGLFENNGAATVYAVGTDAGNSGYYIGSASDDIGASFVWNHNSQLLTIGTGSANDDMRFVTGDSAEAIRILDDGKVGIGTNGPLAGLHVRSAADVGHGQITAQALDADWAKIVWKPLAGAVGDQRAWGFVNNFTANGSFELMRSTTAQGDPTTTVLTFDKDSKATFAGTSQFSGMLNFGSGTLGGSLTYSGGNLSAVLDTYGTATSIEVRKPLMLTEQAQPSAAPVEGGMKIWHSNGTGAGNAGDLMIWTVQGGIGSTNVVNMTEL